MKCFNHHNIDAIGLCKACNKGLCPECAVEVSNSIACKSTCQEEVKTIDKLVKKTKVTAEAQRKNRMFMPSFFLVTGGIICQNKRIWTSILNGIFLLGIWSGANFY